MVSKFLELTFLSEIFNFTWKTALMLAASALLCVLVHYSTSKNEPPPSSIFWLWEISGFLMSLAWIYMLANVIVDILTTYELISGISTALLGLTVLSWGNSVGDAFATIAISRRGFGEMALTGCIAGPVFNVMFGIGISTMLVNLKIDGGIPFNIEKLDA
jgi:sodium/potassium/calcium exchanger 6